MLNIIAATVWCAFGVYFMLAQPEVPVSLVAGLCCYTLTQVHLKGE